MEIVVRSPTGVVHVTLESGSTLTTLKEIIHAKTHIPPHIQQLKQGYPATIISISDGDLVSSIIKPGEFIIVEEKDKPAPDQRFLTFPMKMLPNQFYRRYQPIGVKSAAIQDITDFLNNTHPLSWDWDGVRLFMKSEIMKNLEELRNKVVLKDPHKIQTLKLESSSPSKSTSASPSTLYHSTIVLLLSGKRYSGKDTVAAEIQKVCDVNAVDCATVHFADEFKRIFCEKYHLDHQRMLIDREYKEDHREQMTQFYHQMANQGFSFTESLSQKIYNECVKGFSKKRIYVIPDLRDLGGIKAFQKLRQAIPHLKVILIRINIKNEARAKRGWISSQIDTDPTETALDNFDDWDLAFDNSKEGLEHCRNWISSQVWPLLAVFL